MFFLKCNNNVCHIGFEQFLLFFNMYTNWKNGDLIEALEYTINFPDSVSLS